MDTQNWPLSVHLEGQMNIKFHVIKISQEKGLVIYQELR